MKKILFPLCLVVASVATFAESADPVKADNRPGAWLESQTKLGITKEQQQEMWKIRSAGGTREEIDAVLTPEQREGVKDMRKRKGANPQKALERLQGRVDLTDEQVVEMRVIAQKKGSRKEMMDVLTKEQRASLRESRQQRKSAMAVEADSDATTASDPK